MCRSPGAADLTQTALSNSQDGLFFEALHGKREQKVGLHTLEWTEEYAKTL